MDPFFPTTNYSKLEALALEIIRQTAKLSVCLHPITRRSVKDLLRTMNSYYSNLIEGHHTHPLEIEKALKRDYSQQPAKRALQLESIAHIEVQKLLESRLEKEPEINIWSVDFLCWIHKEFYSRLPKEFLKVKSQDGNKEHTVTPGEIRSAKVIIGKHIPPSPNNIKTLLSHFESAYSVPNKARDEIQNVIAVAASHHRLAWIHPFLDGNGRVLRLFTQAFLIKAQLDAGGLWSTSRGLARHRDDYYTALAWGDSPRRGDLDGRGSLSDAGLYDFCNFFLETCIDQIKFMEKLLELDTFQDRIRAYTERRRYLDKLKTEAEFLLREALLRGEFPRGEAARITGLSERSARNLLAQLVDEGLLVSDSPKTAVRLGFPGHAIGYFFPRLYPESIELSS